MQTLVIHAFHTFYNLKTNAIIYNNDNNNNNNNNTKYKVQTNLSCIQRVEIW